MEEVPGIIAEFAKYLSILINYIREFLANFNKKEDKPEDTTAAE